MTCYVTRRSLGTKVGERLVLDIFQNGGLVENLKFGRRNPSFSALLEVIFMFSFLKCISL